MAQIVNLDIPANTWTELTNANAAAVRVSNLGGSELRLKGTVGSTTPTDDEGAIPLAPGQTLLSDVTLAVLWPEPSGVNRLWAFCQVNGKASVSHADA